MMAFGTRYHTKLFADRIGQSAADVLEEFLNKLEKESVENSLLVWRYI